jgi:HAD superfamily hydrolase (TIGR01509 family)
MSAAGLQAVLWDLDGTLIDSEPAWLGAEFELAARHGATWSEEDALRLVGNDLLTSALYIRDHMGLDLTPRQIVDQLLARVGETVRREVPWRAGARELLLAQHAAGVPAALVTMSYRSLASTVVDALPMGTFQAVVVGDEVSYGKPHPEPYLAAAALLGADPTRCLAIEDSSPGATSAENAGCAVLVVPNHVWVPPSPRRVFRRGLAGLEVADLETLMALEPGSTAKSLPICDIDEL